tara:strand:+ start:96 stop:1325 length:1230 start_codon:yes stop_codon:yes gene_type:complete
MSGADDASEFEAVVIETGAEADAGDAPGRTINTYSLRAGVPSTEEGKLDLSILSNIDELIQTIGLGVYDLTMNNPTMIFSMEQDAYVPMKLKDDQLRSLSYTFTHDDQQRYINVTRAEDAGGGATEGRGLKIKLTLAPDDDSWHAEVIDPGYGYANDDEIRIYGNISGLNLYLALKIHSLMTRDEVRTLFDEVRAADYHYKAEYGPICGGSPYSGRIEWSDVGGSNTPWRRSFANYRGIVANLGFHGLQLVNGTNVDRLTTKLFENEQKAGMSADNGEGLKVLSKILGSAPVREFRRTVLLTGTGPSFQAGGPVDKLMDGFQLQYVAGLSSLKEAATKLPGTYVQSGFAFGKLQFKRFGGVVTDEASFTARVRPMIPDEHFAAVSAHLSGLSDGSIVRPKYIKDYIKKL